MPGSQAGVEGGPGALQGADDCCRRDAEQAGSLGGGEANHLAHVYAPSSEGGQRADTARYGELFRHLLAHGIYVAPSQFECLFVSLAHSDEDIDRTVEAVGDFFGD